MKEINRDYTPNEQVLFGFSVDTLEAALGECQREAQVRERCYPKWVAEGRVSKIDARDRELRIKNAVQIIDSLLTVQLEQ